MKKPLIALLALTFAVSALPAQRQFTVLLGADYCSQSIDINGRKGGFSSLGFDLANMSYSKGSPFGFFSNLDVNYIVAGSLSGGSWSSAMSVDQFLVRLSVDYLSGFGLRLSLFPVTLYANVGLGLDSSLVFLGDTGGDCMLIDMGPGASLLATMPLDSKFGIYAGGRFMFGMLSLGGSYPQEDLTISPSLGLYFQN